MATKDEVVARLRDKIAKGQYVGWRRMFTGRLLANNVVSLAGARPGYVWVRTNLTSRDETQVRVGVFGVSRVNIPVMVGPDLNGNLELKGLNTDEAVMTMGGNVAASLLPAITPDTNQNVIIGGRQFRPGKMRPSEVGGLFVWIEPFHYDGGYWPGGHFEMTPPSTTDLQAWCLLALDPSDGSIYQFTGTEYETTIPMLEGEVSVISVTSGYIPLEAVVLHEGQTVITGGERWADARLHIGMIGGGGGAALTVKEADGTPTATSVDTIVVTNGSLTDDGGGQVTLSVGGGAALTVKEADGTPTATSVDTIVVTNGSLTDDGGGQVTLSVGSGGSLTVEEVDTSPSVSSVTKIVVPNGRLTDDGGGQVTLSMPAGGGDLLSDPAADPDNIIQSQDVYWPGLTIKEADYGMSPDLHNGILFLDKDDAEAGAIVFEEGVLGFNATGNAQFCQFDYVNASVGMQCELISNNSRELRGTFVATTDDTETVGYEHDMPAGNVYFVKARVAARESTGAYYLAAEISMIVHRLTGGDVTIDGTPTVTITTNSTATVDVNADTGTQYWQILITGVASEDWYWNISTDVLS